MTEGRRRFAFWLFWAALAAWTWKLVAPKPLPEALDEWFSAYDLLRLVAAKTLHATGYAFLTALAGRWVPNRRPPLTFALALLMLHGQATEVIQTMVPNRTGLARDVLIDWAGVALGLAVARRNWRPVWRA